MWNGNAREDQASNRRVQDLRCSLWNYTRGKLGLLGCIKNFSFFGLKSDAIDLGETSSGNPKFLKLDNGNH